MDPQNAYFKKNKNLKSDVIVCIGDSQPFWGEMENYPEESRLVSLEYSAQKKQ